MAKSLEILIRQPIEPLAGEDEWKRLTPPVRDALNDIGVYEMPDGKSVMLTVNDFHKLLACVFMTAREMRHRIV